VSWSLGLGVLVGTLGCGLPEGEDEAEDGFDERTAALGAPRIACPTAMTLSGNGFSTSVGASGVSRTIRPRIDGSSMVCEATGAAIPAGSSVTTLEIVPAFGTSLSASASGGSITVRQKLGGVIETASRTYHCAARSYAVSAAGWTGRNVGSTPVASFTRSGNLFTMTCAYSTPAAWLMVTRARPSDITFAAGSGFYRSSDLTAAEKQQICGPRCSTSCTAGFRGGPTDGIAECIASCTASCAGS
jgi:hypothetical protein